MIHTLIIPDIHGRLFWKEALNKFSKEDYPNIDIIFLGDYLDPYEFEHISKEQAIINFEEIIRIAKEDNRIHLLLGNHDWHYIDHIDDCRIDHINYHQIKSLFVDNKDLFKIAYKNKIDNITYLYTHAGITNGWINKMYDIANTTQRKPWVSEEQKLWVKENILDKEFTIELLNEFPNNFQTASWLGMISYARGGDFRYGSCIWADYSEHENSYEPFRKDTYQIFAHSLGIPSLDEGVVTENYAMLDSRCAWILNDDKTIKKL